jgi:hypothetical protein
MKRSGVLLVVLTLLGLMGACKSSSTKIMEETTPPWLNDLPPEDCLWGIGTARQTSESLSMTTAEARGRVAIARQLNSRVQAMFIDYNRDAGTTGSQANLSLQEDVSRSLSHIQLSGAKPIKKWKNSDGTWWYLVEYNKANARDDVGKIFDSEAARYAEFKADEALRMMDAQLAKNEKPLQVATD